MSLHVGSMDDFVDEEIPLDHTTIDQIFRRSLKSLGIKCYLQKLQDVTDMDKVDEQLIAAAFVSFAKQLSQHTDGYKSVSLEDLMKYGLKDRHIMKLRGIVHQVDNESPKNVSKGLLGNKNSSTPDDYPDDFEVEEDNDVLITGDSALSRESDEFYRGGKGVLATAKVTKYANNAHDELEIIDDEEDHEHQPPKQRPTIHQEMLAPKNAPFSPAIPAPFPVLDEVNGGIGFRSSTASGISGKRRKKNSSWIREGRWKRGEAIGKGSFGEVYKAMNDKGKLFAVKQLNMAGKQNEVEDLLREIEMMKELEHPNIVAYVGACVDEDKGLVYIFQEWVPGGSVAHLLKNFGPFDIGTIRSYTRQILFGLVYLHENGIVHRDIKGGNVLVDDTGTVKLADFGASTKLNFGKTQNTTTVKGTPYFMAPETLSDSKYGRKGDIWAVGCTIIQMLTGDPPWKDCNLQNLVQLHMHLLQWTGPPVFAREVPREVHACLERCFAKDAEKRPSAVELLECSYLQSGDDLDESTNSLAEQLGGQGLGGLMGPFSAGRPNSSRAGVNDDDDKLEDSAIVLKQQISRAVSRASLSVQERAGMANLAAAKPLGQPNAGAGSSNPFGKAAVSNDNTQVTNHLRAAMINGSTNSDSGANDSTMADIEKQLQVRREKQQRSAIQQSHHQPQQSHLVGGPHDEHLVPATDAVFYSRNANQSAALRGGNSAGPAQTSSIAPSSSSSNPFAKGQTAIGRKSMSPASNSQQQQAGQETSGIARSSSQSPSSESHSRPQSLSPAFERRSNSHSGKDRDKQFTEHGRDNGGRAAPGEGIASRITDDNLDDRDNRRHRSPPGQPHHHPLPRSREHSKEPVATITPPRHNSNNNDSRQYHHSQPQNQRQVGDTDDDDDDDDDHYRQEKDDYKQQHPRNPTNSDSQTDDSSHSSNHNQRNRRHVADDRSRSRDMRDRESKHSGDRQRRGSDSDWEEKDEQSAALRGRGAAWLGQNGESRMHSGSASGMIGQQLPGRLITGATVRQTLGKDALPYDDRDSRNRDGQDQQRFAPAPALKKKLAVRNSMGSASTSSLGLGLGDVACSGLDGVRSRTHNDWERDAGRERGIASGSLVRNRPGYSSYHDNSDDNGDLDFHEEAELDVLRTGSDGKRRAATSSSAVRSHASIVPEKRVHTAGASMPISGRNNSNIHRYDHHSSPSDDRRAVLGRYAPPESATAAPFDNSDDDTAEEGSDQDGQDNSRSRQQQQRIDSWTCAISHCRYLNYDPEYFDACEKCGVKRGGGKSIHQLGKR